MQKLRSRNHQGTSTTLLSTAQHVVTDLYIEIKLWRAEIQGEIHEKVQSVHCWLLHFVMQGNTSIILGGVLASVHFFWVNSSSEIKVAGGGLNASMAKVAFPTRAFSLSN